ncbi:penicillin-binding protein 1C [Agaricicola taiwanensis]|uniref:peptidoglycan glycosyltransferase n=1 Tax=Agaricicola taiwanensis TaxID=591372 RepID=A0A8J2YAU6_9RHOB|nr:penicillin-binding protein 1C [Agaricicola taiwanensis]GGE30541.1 penicillin-binding protein 1C [Agaricicola taiwanensis]
MAATGRGLLQAAVLSAAVLTGAAAIGGGWIATRSAPPLEDAREGSTLVVDRNGRLLRAFTTGNGIWRLPATTGEVDPRLIAYLMAYEDKRFRDHHGVDPRAMMRAAGQALIHGRIISGGSTLTMQTVRLLTPDRSRTFTRKAAEIGAALALERQLTKDEILDIYLTRAPYGGNLEGVRAASLAWFGKEPTRLSPGEAALLVALPQSPEARRPDRDPAAARRARDRVLDRLAVAGALEPAEAEAAKDEPVPDGRRDFPVLAAHLAEHAVAETPGASRIQLTIDRPLQEQLEALARERAHAMGTKISVAIMVVETATGAVLAHVGGAGYFDEARAGHVDLAQSVRSPGSALKPFIYALAFEDGIAHPQTLIEDRPTRFGTYVPENFDDGFQGTVTAEKALQFSLNVPAVAVLDAVGPQRFMSRLTSAGVRLVLPSGAAPSLAIGLGGAGITLADLAQLYSSLARGGASVPLLTRLDPSPPPIAPRRPLTTPAAAWMVAHALAGAPPPPSASGGRIAFKTGTSYGYRDAWAVGFDGRYTVAVWVGRPDGASSPGLVGRMAAAPILYDAFARVSPERAPLPPAPSGVWHGTTAQLPAALQRLGPVGGAAASAIPPLEIAYPPDGARVDLSGGQDPLALKANGGVPPMTWLIDGQPISSPMHRREASWPTAGPGFLDISVIDATGASAQAQVRVD